MVVIPAQAGIQTRVYPRTRNRRRHCHSHLHRHSGQFCVLSNKTRLPCHTVLGPSWLKAGPSGSSQTGRKVRSGDNGTKWDGNQKFFVPRHMERCPSALISAFCPLAGGGNGTKWDKHGTEFSHRKAPWANCSCPSCGRRISASANTECR